MVIQSNTMCSNILFDLLMIACLMPTTFGQDVGDTVIAYDIIVSAVGVKPTNVYILGFTGRATNEGLQSFNVYQTGGLQLINVNKQSLFPAEKTRGNCPGVTQTFEGLNKCLWDIAVYPGIINVDIIRIEIDTNWDRFGKWNGHFVLGVNYLTNNRSNGLTLVSGQSMSASRESIPVSKDYNFLKLNTYSSKFYLCYYTVSLAIAIFIQYSISRGNIGPGILRDNDCCKKIFVLKVINIGVLSFISGFMATTASLNSIQILTAQSAANFVNVISITYGTQDYLPHGRGDVINGAIGSLVSQVAIGIISNNRTVHTIYTSIFSIGLNFGLILVLFYHNIDLCNNTRHEPVSVELLEYREVENTLSDEAKYGRNFVNIISFIFSFLSIVSFYLNDSSNASYYQTFIVCAPLITTVLSNLSRKKRRRIPP